MNRSIERRNIDADIKAFLSNGGKIETLKPARNKKTKMEYGSIWNAGRKQITTGRKP